CRGNVALSKVKHKSHYCGDNQHYGDQQFGPETCHPAFVRPARGDHGKSMCKVSPFFSSTGPSRVVLLSIHAFSMYWPEGSSLNRNRPSASVTINYCVSIIRMSPLIGI